MNMLAGGGLARGGGLCRGLNTEILMLAMHVEHWRRFRALWTVQLERYTIY